MNKKNIENLFSKERLNNFYSRFPSNENKAFELYKANIKLSEALYPLLSILEISLRNTINRMLNQHFNSDNWFEELSKLDLFSELTQEIEEAKIKITNRKKIVNQGKLTAELTFGFWTKLFNSKYEMMLWKPLRLSFPNIPKNERKRNQITVPLNKIRNLRNRVYHYEPIIWNIYTMEEIIRDCYRILNWISLDLPFFTKEFDRVELIIIEIKKLYSIQN